MYMGGKQMHRVELAQKLRENIRTEGKLSDFVFAILQDTAYCTMKEMQEIVLRSGKWNRSRILSVTRSGQTS